MIKILSKMLSIIKFVLLLLAFALIFIGLLYTNKRLEKSLLDSITTFIPFILIFILTIVNMIFKKAKMSENLLFNFVSCIIFISIIYVGYRAKFDTSMLLYYKYQINYNPNYLADNLSSIQVMLYSLSACNILFLLSALFIPKVVSTFKSEEQISKQFVSNQIDNITIASNESNKVEEL